MVYIDCKVCDKEFQAENKRTKMCPTCSHQKQLDRCKEYKKKNKEHVSEYNKYTKKNIKKKLIYTIEFTILKIVKKSKNDKQ